MTDTTPLTDQQLAAIRAREAAARPGPWYREDDKQDLNRWVANEAGTVEINLGYLGNNNQADAEFVAHAREDVPALLAEVDRLRAENAELAAELGARDEKARKRWIKAQEKQLGIRFADFRAGRWEMDLAMGREMAAAYVAMAKTMLGDAPNYSETRLEFDVKIAESPETYTLVVQRHAPGALTPHEARQRAEAERDKALAEADRLRAQVAREVYKLKVPAPAGSEHYQSGWDDAIEAATDTIRNAN